jgi:N-acetylglucosamine-6-sulfatase
MESKLRAPSVASALLKCVVATLALAVLVPGPVSGQESDPHPETPPNILVIVTDDQRHDTMHMLPAAKANFDTYFSTGIVNTPNCCPSRASIFSGLYSRNHGVESNGQYPNFDESQSLALHLQAIGYRTGFVGKYLNKGVKLGGSIPPGWNEFHGFAWGEDQVPITEGDIYESFVLRRFDGETDESVSYPREQDPDAYSTRVLAEISQEFVARSNDASLNPESKPWALFVFPYAPHFPYTVESRYRGHPVPRWNRPPSFEERNMTDKPRQVRRSPMRDRRGAPGADISYRKIRQRQLRMLLSVNDLIAGVWNTIDTYDQRSATWGIFTSDNGESWGEHYLGQKLHAYEESIRVPFRMAVPDAHGKREGIPSNVDITPTLLEVAGDTSDRTFDGRSLVPVALGERTLGRRAVFIENRARLQWSGLRTHRWKYVRWPTGDEELYDLRRDPHELRNAGSRNSRRLHTLRAALSRIEAAHPRDP